MIFEPVGLGFNKKDFTKDEEIALNKQFTKLLHSVHTEIKGETCFYCGKRVSSFCESHFVPKFCLNNISINGRVSGYNAILGLPSMGTSIGKEAPGIGEAGTFRIICRDCDSTIFRDYENPENYSAEKQPSQKILAEIAMKDYLKFVYKRMFELEMSRQARSLCDDNSLFGHYAKRKIEIEEPVQALDLKAYTSCFMRAKKHCEKGSSGYYVVYYRILDYVAPVAVQSPVTLSIDIEGGVVNNIYNQDPSFNPTDIHVCVFPLKDKTVVLLFIDDGDKHYRRFYKQLRKLSAEDQLGVINYIIFLYCEDYFLAKEISSIVDVSQLKEVAETTPVIVSSTPIDNALQISAQYSLANWKRIPNLLSEAYKIR